MKKFVLLVCFVSFFTCHSIQAKQKIASKLDSRPILSSKNIDSATLNVKYKIVFDDIKNEIECAKSLERLRIKGEFETSEEFSKRSEVTTKKINEFSNSVFIFGVSEKKYPIFPGFDPLVKSKYNADQKTMRIIIETPIEACQAENSFSTYRTIPIEKNTTSSQYEGKNSYGATATITQDEYTYSELLLYNDNFEIPQENVILNIFAPAFAKGFEIECHFDVSMNINEAKINKGNIGAIFVVYPSQKINGIDGKFQHFKRTDYGDYTRNLEAGSFTLSDYKSSKEATVQHPYHSSDSYNFLLSKMKKFILYNTETGEILFIKDYAKKEELKKEQRQPVKDSYLYQ